MPRSHALRYVLKNRKTDEPLFVVVFTLLPKDQVEEEEKPVEDAGDKKGEAKASSAGDDDDLD